MNMIAAFVGRVLLSIIFIVSGISKLFDPATTEAMITGAGLPAGLAIPTGIFELVGGLEQLGDPRDDEDHRKQDASNEGGDHVHKALPR